MDKLLTKRCITHLTKLGQGKRQPQNTFFGICMELEIFIEKNNRSRKYINGYRIIEASARNWAKRFSSVQTPVGGREEYMDKENGKLWKNPRRLELCLHAAEYLKEHGGKGIWDNG